MVDYRELLKKYLACEWDCEGITCVNEFVDLEKYSVEEKEALLIVEAEAMDIADRFRQL